MWQVTLVFFGKKPAAHKTVRKISHTSSLVVCVYVRDRSSQRTRCKVSCSAVFNYAYNHIGETHKSVLLLIPLTLILTV
jgi:hypothetical protein